MTTIPVPDRSRYLVRRQFKLASILAVLGLGLTWEALSRGGAVPSLFLPAPSVILRSLGELIAAGELQGHLAASLGRLVGGLALGGALGILAGLAMGFSDLADAVGNPVVAAVYPIPKIALLPLLILWFGIGEASKVAVIALGTFFPLAINTYAGVRGCDPGLVRAAIAFGAGRLAVVRDVLLPGALPMIFAGLRLASGVALLLLVSAEMIGADRGLGFLILHAGNLMLTTQLMAGVLVLSGLGLAFTALVRALERVCVPWRD